MFRQLLLFSVLIVVINSIAAQLIIPEGITKVQKVSSQQIINFPRIQAQNQKLTLRTPAQSNKYILRSRKPTRIINKRQPTDGQLNPNPTTKMFANNALNKEQNPQNVRMFKLAPKNGVNEKITGGMTMFNLI
ncbi:uncharacterized protein LOC121739582 [Aricia agestis]|uniref:uncharacterized protein LOC121739582 n=1 Tax=Aricia agestis TaxID=91739 RepID=UPI001C208FFC|nr:uncharacterized protein LOC121739582 [Aricia agestis]